MLLAPQRSTDVVVFDKRRCVWRDRQPQHKAAFEWLCEWFTGSAHVSHLPLAPGVAICVLRRHGLVRRVRHFDRATTPSSFGRRRLYSGMRDACSATCTHLALCSEAVSRIQERLFMLDIAHIEQARAAGRLAAAGALLNVRESYLRKRWMSFRSSYAPQPRHRADSA